MLNKTKKLKQGVTLLEILIYTALSVIVLLIVSNMLLMVFSFWQNNRAKKELFTATNFIVNNLRQDIYDSYDVVVPAGDDFSDELTLVSTLSGQINYTVQEGGLRRNGEAITDDQIVVTMSTADDQGFRKIGRTIDWQFILTSLQLPIQGTYSSQLIRGTALLSN